MAGYKPLDWYDAPLYYDIIYDQDTARDADFLEAVGRQYVGRSRCAVLEPACGSGRLLAELARRGHAVAGFDASQPMLEFARQRLKRAALRAQVKHARLEQFTYRRRFDLAHCLVSTFKYLSSEAAAHSHLQCVAETLKPGGVYVLGLHLTDYHKQQRERERWTGCRQGVQVVCNVQEWPADVRRRTQRAAQSPEGAASQPCRAIRNELAISHVQPFATSPSVVFRTTV